MSQQGYRPFFVFRSEVDARVVTSALPWVPVRQAPVHLVEVAPDAPRPGLGYSYVDVLHRCGYASPDSLRSLVTQWRALIDEIEPTLIVCDHSPTVLLAAMGRVPVVHLGSGFASPPPGKPFLPLHPPAQSGAAEREAAVLRSLQTIGSEFSLPEIRHPSDIFHLGESFVCCLPELDPYRTVRDKPADGPMHTLPSPGTESRREFVFGYLSATDRRVPALLRRVARANVPCSVFVRDMPLHWPQEYAGTSLRFFDTPQDLNKVLAVASAVIHHGGISTSETALAIGCPQFVLPSYLEQMITAQQLESLGCGVDVARQRSDPGQLIRNVIKDPELQVKAERRAKEVASRARSNLAETVLNRCFALAV